MIDSELLDKNDAFTALPQTYVIFITENDYYGAGLPVYHVERHIEELQYASFGDGSHILYVNGSFRDLTHPVGRLMHDFHCRNADEMCYPVFAERMHYFKESERGYQTMSRITEELMEIGRNIGFAEGHAEGHAEGRIEVFSMLYAQNRISKKEFAAYVGISVDEVDAFIKDHISLMPRIETTDESDE